MSATYNKIDKNMNIKKLDKTGRKKTEITRGCHKELNKT